jgi:hypothetical protein
LTSTAVELGQLVLGTTSVKLLYDDDGLGVEVGRTSHLPGDGFCSDLSPATPWAEASNRPWAPRGRVGLDQHAYSLVFLVFREVDADAVLGGHTARCSFTGRAQ